MRNPAVLEINPGNASFHCTLTKGCVLLLVEGVPQQAVTVAGGYCGDEAIWLKITCSSDFWLELHASQPTYRQIHARGDFYKNRW